METIPQIPAADATPTPGFIPGMLDADDQTRFDPTKQTGAINVLDVSTVPAIIAAFQAEQAGAGTPSAAVSQAVAVLQKLLPIIATAAPGIGPLLTGPVTQALALIPAAVV